MKKLLVGRSYNYINKLNKFTLLAINSGEAWISWDDNGETDIIRNLSKIKEIEDNKFSPTTSELYRLFETNRDGLTPEYIKKITQQFEYLIQGIDAITNCQDIDNVYKYLEIIGKRKVEILELLK